VNVLMGKPLVLCGGIRSFILRVNFYDTEHFGVENFTRGFGEFTLA